MGIIEDWYDEPDRTPDTGLPYQLPFGLESTVNHAVSEFFDNPNDPLDMSRVPPKNAGLPFDVDVLDILAGGDGIASKPDILSIGQQLVTDVQSLSGALVSAFGGDIAPLQEWISAHTPSWLPDFSGWVGIGLSTIQSMVSQITDIFRGFIVTPINSAIQGVKEWFANLLGWRTTTDTSTAVVQAQVVTIQQVFAVRSNRPLWEGLDPTGESSFPLSALAGGSLVEVSLGSSKSVGCCIRLESPVEKKQITFKARRSGAASGFYLDLYLMNPDGSFSRKHSSDDLAGDLTTTRTTMQVEIPSTLVEMGDVYMAQFRGPSTVYVAGASLPTDPNAWGFRPLQIGMERNGTAPETIDTGSADAAYAAFVPYVQIGADVGQINAARNFYDNFNRAALGAGWVPFRFMSSDSDIAISGSRLVKPAAALAQQVVAGIYALPLVSDNAAVEFDVTSVNSVPSGGLFCATSDFAASVGLLVTNSSVKIAKVSTSAWAGTTKTSVSRSGNAGRWKLTYTASDNTFRAYIDGVEVTALAWTDSSNEIAHGKGHRFAGAHIQSISFTPGSPIDNWQAYDVAA